MSRAVDDEEFNRAYRHKLHTIGVGPIFSQFGRLTEEYMRPLVLLCFEKDPAGCHRGSKGGFAAWWQAKTGEVVPEVEDLAALRPFTESTVQEEEVHDGRSRDEGIGHAG